MNDSAKDMDERYQTFIKYESMALESHTANEIIDKLSVAKHELLELCYFKPFNIRSIHVKPLRIKPVDCEWIKPIVSSIYEGRKCFTYFSLVMNQRQRASGNDSEDGASSESQANNSFSPPISSSSSQKEIEEESEKVLIRMLALDDNQPIFEFISMSLKSTMIFDLGPRIETKIVIDDDTWDYLGKWSITMTGETSVNNWNSD